MISLDQLKSDGVYFFVPTVLIRPQKMDFTCECLVSGLTELGVPVFSNVEAPNCVQRDLGRMGSHFYVFNVTELNYSGALLKGIAEFESPHKIIVSMADTNSVIFTPEGIPSLMTHENKFRQICGTRVPWAIGLSENAMNLTAGGISFEQRKEVILRNFRPSRNQDVRRMLDLALIGHLEKHFMVDSEVSGNHFEKLSTYVGCLAYGGVFDEALISNPYFAALPKYQAIASHVTYHRNPVIVRWDSWRWWESLAAGCLSFQLDLEKYGLLLPVMPQPWQEYIPINLADPKGTVETLMDQRPRWAEIAENGRLWARAHYSPRAAAQRFIDYVTGDQPGQPGVPVQPRTEQPQAGLT